MKLFKALIITKRKLFKSGFVIKTKRLNIPQQDKVAGRVYGKILIYIEIKNYMNLHEGKKRIQFIKDFLEKLRN